MCIADENCPLSYNKLYISKDDHSNLKSLSRFKQLVIRKGTLLRGKYNNIIEGNQQGKQPNPFPILNFKQGLKNKRH